MNSLKIKGKCKVLRIEDDKGSFSIDIQSGAIDLEDKQRARCNTL